MHVWLLLSLLSVLSACLARFTERAQCMFGPVYWACSVHDLACLLSMLRAVLLSLLSMPSAGFVLFTERAHYMFGPV